MRPVDSQELSKAFTSIKKQKSWEALTVRGWMIDQFRRWVFGAEKYSQWDVLPNCVPWAGVPLKSSPRPELRCCLRGGPRKQEWGSRKVTWEERSQPKPAARQWRLTTWEL